MTFGLMLVRTASSTVLPVPFVARSIAQARLKSREMPALSAAINASITWSTLAAGQIMRFERIARNLESRFHRGDSIIDN